MNPAVEAMTGDLAEELAANARPTDTRSVRIRNHHLKQMGRSPAHCRYSILFGLDEPSLTKRLGSGVHSLLLGGQPLIRYNGKRDLRTKAYQEFAAANQNAIICSPSEYETANRTADAVRNDRLASEVLLSKGTKYEQTIEWDWMGRSRRCTPDAHGPDLLAELKTTRDGSVDRFKWDVLRFGYHTQLFDYANALLETRSHAPRNVFIVAVEKAPPYVVATYRLTKNDLEMGGRLVRGWMERLLECEKNNDWPGYSASIQDLDLPTRDDELDLIFGDDDETDAH